MSTGSGNTLYVSRDVNPPGSGKQNLTNVSSLTNASGGLPTTSAGLITTHITPPASPLSLGGNNGSISLTAGTANGVNNSRIGNFVYLSPESYFFASPTVLYVADSGQPKNGNAGKAALGEGGLQKWVLTNNVWTFDYDLFNGLNLVDNNNLNLPGDTTTTAGVTGLLGLTGMTKADGTVELFATSYGLNELFPSYLYEITDTLGFSTSAQASSGTFTTLFAADANTSIRGVAFAPVPEPGSLALFGAAMMALMVIGKRKKNQTS